MADDATRSRVYVGPAMWPWRGKMWAHLTADTPQALHAFADLLGLNRAWFQSKPGRPWFDHYDVTEAKRSQAISLGAVEVTMREESKMFLAKREAARV